MRKHLLFLLSVFLALPVAAQVQISASAGGGVQIGGSGGGGGGTPPGGSVGEIQFYCLTGGAVFCGDYGTTDGNGNWTTHSVYLNNATQGVDILGEGTGAIPTPTPTHYAGFVGPASGTAAYVIQLPLVQPSGASLLNIAAPSTVNSLNQAVATFELISDFAKVGSNNTFAGTQTFNNVVIDGSCTGCGGGGSGGNYFNLAEVGSPYTASGCTISGAVCTVGSPTATVTLSSIPSGYTKLIVTFTGGSADSSNDVLDLQFNGDSGSHYWSTADCGGSGLSGVGVGQVGGVGALTTPSIPAILTMVISNYTQTVTRKSWSTTGSSWQAPSAACKAGGMWNNGDASFPAITSITFSLSSTDNITAGTTFTVEGTN